MIERFLGLPLDYDRQRGTALTETAWRYLENHGYLATTATALRVHPNTVKQGLDRIDKLLGPDWRHGSAMVDTHFALRLWRLRQRGASVEA